MNARRIALLLYICLGAACDRGESRSHDGPQPPEQSPALRTAEGLVFQTRSWIVEGGTEPDTLYSRMILRNEGDRTLSLDVGSHCSFVIAVYRIPARTPPAVWAGPGFAICDRAGAGVDLAPGDSAAPRDLTFRKPVSKILGDSLPNGQSHPSGRYYLVAEMPINYNIVSVPAGAVTLRRPGTPSDTRTSAD